MADVVKASIPSRAARIREFCKIRSLVLLILVLKLVIRKDNELSHQGRVFSTSDEYEHLWLELCILSCR